MMNGSVSRTRACLVLPILLLLGCASSPYKGNPGFRDAGKELKVIYQSRADILKSKKIDPADPVESTLLPVGGRLVFEIRKETMGGMPGFGSKTSFAWDISNQNQELNYVNINVGKHFYVECTGLSTLREHESWMNDVFGSDTYYQACDIDKPLDSDFEVLLMNLEKVPIGKYSIRIAN